MVLNDGTCYIIGAGSFAHLLAPLEDHDLLIAADGGYRYCEKMGLEPDVLLGDFDSLEIVPKHRNLIRHSPIKDDTDMALAAAYGEERGFRRFVMYGGLGGRLDHTMANLQLLTALSRKGYAAYLIGEGSIITAVTDGKLVFGPSASGMISVFCAGEKAEGVNERGLKYSLDHAVLTCERALGVSNEFTGQESMIEVERGTLLVLWDESEGFEKVRVDKGVVAVREIRQSPADREG